MKRKPPIERFWPKVRVLGSAECWPWLGALRGLPGKQYGNFWYGVDGYRNIGAHCFAWILKNGPIPPGVWILHRCDFMLCCNESHLFPGDAQINNADMAAKNRNRFSERHWNCRLTDEQIEEIRIATARGCDSDFFDLLVGQPAVPVPLAEPVSVLCSHVGVIDLSIAGKQMALIATEHEVATMQYPDAGRDRSILEDPGEAMRSDISIPVDAVPEIAILFPGQSPEGAEPWPAFSRPKHADLRPKSFDGRFAFHERFSAIARYGSISG